MAIIIDKVVHKYSPGTVYETTALDNVSLVINDGDFIGIIGGTGSGKSTLVQHLNGLLKPTGGNVYYNGRDIAEKDFDLKELRTQVGIVFQYPEYQMFENTVFEDVKFGPKNQGLSDKEAALRAFEALETVGFPRELHEQSPFDLSGGQKRIAAIAGVLAMKPLTLILDEPTAGLDPVGKREILTLLKNLHENTKRTIILVSHNMEDVARYADRIVVMNHGKVLFDDSARSVFSHTEELGQVGLAIPEVSFLMGDLRQMGLNLPETVLTEEEACSAILNALGVLNA